MNIKTGKEDSKCGSVVTVLGVCVRRGNQLEEQCSKTLSCEIAPNH